MKRLLVVHVDGLGHAALLRAVERGQMPWVKGLLENGYVAHTYRCGLPSTTPCVQAAILYGDNTDIAGFRWYDKRSGVGVGFGPRSSFKQVAHRYLQGARGLLEGGAAIAACYQAGASQTLGLSYKERTQDPGVDAGPRIAVRFLLDPGHLLDMAWHLVFATVMTGGNYLRSRLRGRRPAVPYVLTDIVEEIFVHHLTRFAVGRAMREGLPVIYAGFYAYDETAHAFGPEDWYSHHMLRHVDHTVRSVFETNRELGESGYEIVVLSDHGQTPSEPFTEFDGRSLGEAVSALLPSYEVEELTGGTYGPLAGALDGKVALAYSGGLAHLYLTNVSGRVTREELERRCPGLVSGLARLEGVGFLVLRAQSGDLLVTREGERPLNHAHDVLAVFDDPHVLAAQLRKLNRFQTAGDVILVGRWRDGRQVDFENQLGGHGCVGGEQGHPFLLARAHLGMNLDGITDACRLHPLLQRLREA